MTLLGAQLGPDRLLLGLGGGDCDDRQQARPTQVSPAPLSLWPDWGGADTRLFCLSDSQPGNVWSSLSSFIFPPGAPHQWSSLLS